MENQKENIKGRNIYKSKSRKREFVYINSEENNIKLKDNVVVCK